MRTFDFQRLFQLAWGAVLLFLCAEARAEGDFSIMAYRAVLTGDTLGDTMLFAADYDYSYSLTAVGAGRKTASYGRYVDLEVEGQIVKHSGRDHHLELNALIVERWTYFPWDYYINTSLAAGQGLSYATDIPEIEKLHHDKTSRFLGYLMFEIALSIPRFQQWSLITRIHHRSGAYGLFNGVHGASNALGFGIRYDF
jgi:hypothetical protein